MHMQIWRLGQIRGHQPTLRLFEVQKSLVQKKDQVSSKSASLHNIRGSTGPRGNSMPRHMTGSQAVQHGSLAIAIPVWNSSGRVASDGLVAEGREVGGARILRFFLV